MITILGVSLQYYLKDEFQNDLQGELDSSEIREIAKNTVGDYFSSQLTGADLADVTKNAVSNISSFGIGIGLSLLGVFLAKKNKKSRAAKAIAKILGADVDAIDRSFVIHKLLNDKSYFTRIQRSIIDLLSSKEYDFNKVIDVFVRVPRIWSNSR